VIGFIVLAHLLTHVVGVRRDFSRFPRFPELLVSKHPTRTLKRARYVDL
jgi:hypothetical protein